MTKPRSVRCPLCASLAVATLAVPMSAIAQIVPVQSLPSQSQTPPGAQIERRGSDARIDIRIGGALAAPAGADGVTLKNATTTIDGGFAPVSEGTPAILPAPGSTITLAEVYAAAARVQQAYLEAGYPLVRVFVPVQDLDTANAKVRLQVVSGYIADVKADALDPRIYGVVTRYLKPLIGQQNLKAATLERAVLLAGDVSGVQLTSALSPGTQTGETVLIVSGEFAPVQAVLSADNRLSPELGREQATLAAAFNSLLGLGERIGFTYASALDDPSFSRSALRRYAGIYSDLPIGNNGLVIGGDASLSTARPRGAAADLSLYSRFEHLAGRVSYPIIRNRRKRLIISASFDANTETQESLLLAFPVPLSRDKTRVGRIGIDASLKTRSGLYAAAEIEYARGLDILGARRAADASIFEPLSRIGADAVFDKLSANLVIEAVLPKTPVTGRFMLRSQTGFGDPLLRSEQLSVAAPDLISGPPSGSLVGDNGIAARCQIEALAYSTNIHLIPYAFAATARTYLKAPSFFERAKSNTNGYGLGLKTQIPLGKTTVTGAVEYSHTTSKDLNARGDWVTFQLAFRF